VSGLGSVPERRPNLGIDPAGFDHGQSYWPQFADRVAWQY
jgi:hypothetical protein